MYNEDGVPVSGCSMIFLGLSVICIIVAVVLAIAYIGGG